MGKSNRHAKGHQGKHHNQAAQAAQRRAVQGKHELTKPKRVATESELFLDLQREIVEIKSKLPAELWEGTPLEGTLHFILTKMAENALITKNSQAKQRTPKGVVFQKAEEKVQSAMVRKAVNEQQAIFAKLLLLALLARQMTLVETKKQSTSNDERHSGNIEGESVNGGTPFYSISRFSLNGQEYVVHVDENGNGKPLFGDHQKIENSIVHSVLVGDVKSFRAAHGDKKRDLVLPDGSSLFHLAPPKKEILEELKKYYDINARDKNGYAPLDRFNGKTSAERLTYLDALLAAGADPNIEDPLHGGVLTRIVKASNIEPEFQRSYVEILLKHGASVVKSYGKHLDPLELCIENNNPELFQLMLPRAREEEPNVEKRLVFMYLHSGKLEHLRFLAKQGIDLNQYLKDGKSALHLIAGNSIPTIHPQALSTLVELGADINALNENHFTALHTALANYDVLMVEELLRLGASPAAHKYTEKYYPSPFEFVARWESFPKYLALFIDYGFDINSGVEFSQAAMPPLAWALLQNEIKLVNLLLSYAANPNVKFRIDNDFHFENIHFKKGDYTIEKLVNIINRNEITAFFNRIKTVLYHTYDDGGNKKNINTLSTVRLQDKNTFNRVNSKIFTATAAEMGPGIKDKQEGVYVVDKPGVGTVIIQVDFTPETRNDFSASWISFERPKSYEICLAVLYNLFDDLKNFHKNNKVNKKELNEKEIFRMAAEISNEWLIGFLIDEGYDIHYRGVNNNTPLHYIMKKGTGNAVSLLLPHGVDPNAQNLRGETPLHYGVISNNVETLRAIRNHPGLDLTIKNHKGQTALDLARELGHWDAVRELGMLENGNTSTQSSESSWELTQTLKNVFYFFIGPIIVIWAGISAGKTLIKKDKDEDNKLSWNVIKRTIYFNSIGGKLWPSSDKVPLIDGEMTAITQENYLSIKDRINIHYVDEGGRNLLHYGVMIGNLSLVEYALEQNIPVGSKDELGLTPLAYAFYNKHMKIAGLLLSKGANPLWIARDQIKIIHFLFYHENIDLVFDFFKAPALKDGKILSAKQSYAIRRAQVVNELNALLESGSILKIEEREQEELANARVRRDLETAQKRQEASLLELEKQEIREAESKKRQEKEQEKEAARREQEGLKKLEVAINDVKEKITSLLATMDSEKTKNELTSIEADVNALKAKLSDQELETYKNNGIRYGLKSAFLTKDINKLKNANAALDGGFYSTYLEKLEQFKAEYEKLKNSTEDLSSLKTSLDDLYGRLVTYKSGFNDVTLKTIKKKRETLSKEFSEFKSDIDKAEKEWNQKNQENKNKEKEKKKALEAEKERQRQELEKQKEERKKNKGKGKATAQDNKSDNIKLSSIEYEFLNDFVDDLLLLENVLKQQVLTDSVDAFNKKNPNINLDLNTTSFFGLSYYLMRIFKRLDLMQQDQFMHLNKVAPFDKNEGTAWRNRFMHYFYCLFTVAESSSSSANDTLSQFNIKTVYGDLRLLAEYFRSEVLPKIKNVKDKISMKKLSIESWPTDLLPEDFKALQGRSVEDNKRIESWINDNRSIILEYIIQQAESFYVLFKKSMQSKDENYRCLEGIFKGFLYMIGQGLREIAEKGKVIPFSLRCFTESRGSIGHRYDKTISELKGEMGNIEVTVIDEIESSRLRSCGDQLKNLRRYIHDPLNYTETPAQLTGREQAKRNGRGRGQGRWDISDLLDEGSSSNSSAYYAKKAPR